MLDKGQDPGTDGYSAFDGTGFGALLRERGIDQITLVGLATDYCVKNTALDALREGFEVEVDRAGRARDRRRSRATWTGRSPRSPPRAGA